MRAWRDGPKFVSLSHVTRMLAFPRHVFDSNCKARCIFRAPHLMHRCGTRLFKGGSGRRGIAQIRRHSQKCFRPRRHSLQNGCLRHQAIGLTSPAKVKACGEEPLRLGECQSRRAWYECQLGSFRYRRPWPTMRSSHTNRTV